VAATTAALGEDGELARRLERARARQRELSLRATQLCARASLQQRGARAGELSRAEAVAHAAAVALRRHLADEAHYRQRASAVEDARGARALAAARALDGPRRGPAHGELRALLEELEPHVEAVRAVLGQVMRDSAFAFRLAGELERRGGGGGGAAAGGAEMLDW